jgi:hypothetical protein
LTFNCNRFFFIGSFQYFWVLTNCQIG